MSKIMSDQERLEQAQDMRRRYEAGQDLREIAAVYGVNHTSVRDRILKVGGQMRGKGNRTGQIPSKTKTFDELTDAVLRLIPTAEFSYDPDGQLVIHTGLKTVTYEALVPIKNED